MIRGRKVTGSFQLTGKVCGDDSESPLVIQGNSGKKDSLTAEEVFNEHLCSKAFLFISREFI